LNLDKSINKLSERLEAIESQDTINKDQIDSDQVAREKYEEYREHWYSDPPFNTGEEFNFVTETNLPSGQTLEKEWTMIERLAYTDTWERGTNSYLDMLFVRFKLMRRLLSPEGSIYVHLDPNHYS
jgi:adenine specific DNA methylase Mod